MQQQLCSSQQSKSTGRRGRERREFMRKEERRTSGIRRGTGEQRSRKGRKMAAEIVSPFLSDRLTFSPSFLSSKMMRRKKACRRSLSVSVMGQIARVLYWARPQTEVQTVVVMQRLKCSKDRVNWCRRTANTHKMH